MNDMTDTKINEILKNLKNNPIFKMSLGSKELFHSNFLEYLWEVNNLMFVRIINTLLSNTDKQLSETTNYTLSREKENFDICLYHKTDDKIVYDLILENKVKSIPYKKQLEKYIGNGNKDTIFLLLSLAESFPDKDDEEIKKNWEVVNYYFLKEAIKDQKTTWEGFHNDSKYICDYCNFIDQLHQLQKEILNGFDNKILFSDRKTFEKYRIHDLYIKLQCAKFLILLKDKLEKENIAPILFIDNHKDIRNKYKKRGIYLNQNIFRSVGQAAAFLYKNDGDDNDIYEIVIQGNEYRHGINSKKLADTSKDKNESQNNLWNTFMKQQFEKDFLMFANDSFLKGLEEKVRPETIRQNKKSEVQKSDSFRGYNHDYVYKFKKWDDITVSGLLDIMVKDIKYTFN